VREFYNDKTGAGLSAGLRYPDRVVKTVVFVGRRARRTDGASGHGHGRRLGVDSACAEGKVMSKPRVNAVGRRDCAFVGNSATNPPWLDADVVPAFLLSEVRRNS
jgi:hypothetical protein